MKIDILKFLTDNWKLILESPLIVGAIKYVRTPKRLKFKKSQEYTSFFSEGENLNTGIKHMATFGKITAVLQLDFINPTDHAITISKINYDPVFARKKDKYNRYTNNASTIEVPSYKYADGESITLATSEQMKTPLRLESNDVQRLYIVMPFLEPKSVINENIFIKVIFHTPAKTYRRYFRLRRLSDEQKDYVKKHQL